MLRQNDSHRPAGCGVRFPKSVLLIGTAVGLSFVIAGCSADVLRSDSPVFGLNGNTAAVEPDTATAPTGSAQYQQRTASAASQTDQPSPTFEPVARVERRQVSREPVIKISPPTQTPPVVRNRQRVADVAPSAGLPRTSYHSQAYAPATTVAPVTTGALPARGQGIVVQAGDTLYQLARRHNVTVDALRRANGMTGNIIKPGQTLVLPGMGGASVARTQPAGATPTVRPPVQTAAPNRRLPRYRALGAPRGAVAGGGTYVVRRGDSLYAISRATGVSVATLQRLNGITDVRALKPGMTLVVGGDRRGHGAGRSARSHASGSHATRSTTVASRSDYASTPTIKAKPIKTVPVTRARNGTSASTTASVRTPRILNQRPAAPIVTKPRQKVVMAPSATPGFKFRWPARGRIIAPFNRTGPGSKNDGINISLPVGADVAAAAEGVVAYAGSELKGFGNLVLLRHDNGWVSAYAHASEVLVKRGDRIKSGQIIAKSGRSGDVTQPQLHFELRKGTTPVDPMPHMTAM